MLSHGAFDTAVQLQPPKPDTVVETVLAPGTAVTFTGDTENGHGASVIFVRNALKFPWFTV